MQSFRPLFARCTVVLLAGFLVTMSSSARAEISQLRGVDLSPEAAQILTAAIRDHTRAVEGEKGLAEQIVDRLEAAEVDHFDNDGPARALFLAYLGSSYAVLGGEAYDSFSLVNAYRYTNRGIRLMDEAVEIAPDVMTVRATRGFTLTALPVFFQTRVRGREDLAKFLELAETRGKDPVLRDSVHGAIDVLLEWAENTEDQEKIAALKAKKSEW